MTEPKRCCEPAPGKVIHLDSNGACRECGRQVSNNTVPVSEPSLQGTCSKGVCCTIQYGEDAGVCMLDNCSCHTPTPPPTEWEGRFDAKWKDDRYNRWFSCDQCGGLSNIGQVKDFIRETITKALAEQKAGMVEVVKKVPVEYAHTYGSENADTYRAHDAGQEQMKERIIKALSK